MRGEPLWVQPRPLVAGLYFGRANIEARLRAGRNVRRRPQYLLRLTVGSFPRNTANCLDEGEAPDRADADHLQRFIETHVRGMAGDGRS